MDMRIQEVYDDERPQLQDMHYMWSTTTTTIIHQCSTDDTTLNGDDDTHTGLPENIRLRKQRNTNNYEGEIPTAKERYRY